MDIFACMTEKGFKCYSHSQLSPTKSTQIVQRATKPHAALETILLFAQGENEHCTVAVAMAGGEPLTTAFWAGRLLVKREYNCWTSAAGHGCTQLAARVLQPHLTPLPVGPGKRNSGVLTSKQANVKVGVLFFPHKISVSRWVYLWISQTQVSAPTLHWGWEIEGGK